MSTSSQYLKDLIEYQKKEIYELQRLLRESMDREAPSTPKSFVELDIADIVYVKGVKMAINYRDRQKGVIQLTQVP